MFFSRNLFYGLFVLILTPFIWDKLALAAHDDLDMLVVKVDPDNAKILKEIMLYMVNTHENEVRNLMICSAKEQAVSQSLDDLRKNCQEQLMSYVNICKLKYYRPDITTFPCVEAAVTTSIWNGHMGVSSKSSTENQAVEKLSSNGVEPENKQSTKSELLGVLNHAYPGVGEKIEKLLGNMGKSFPKETENFQSCRQKLVQEAGAQAVKAEMVAKRCSAEKANYVAQCSTIERGNICELAGLLLLTPDVPFQP